MVKKRLKKERGQVIIKNPKNNILIQDIQHQNNINKVLVPESPPYISSEDCIIIKQEFDDTDNLQK